MIEINIKSINFAVRTRAQRKVALAIITRQLARIREAEINCLCNMPHNLCMGRNYFIGENAVGAFDTALDYLLDAYDDDRKKQLSDIPF